MSNIQTEERWRAFEQHCAPPDPQQIPVPYILETLSIYRSEHIALQAVQWDGKVLVGHFRPSEYPFTKPGHIDYVTATMATIYVWQLAYVYSRLTIEDQRVIAGVALTTKDFFEARDRGDLVLTKFSLKCRRKVPITQPDVMAVLWHQQVHRAGKYLLAQFAFGFHDGSFQGNAVLAMPIPRVAD